MAILRNETQKQYTNVDNEIFRDMNLHIRDRGLLTTLLSFPDNWEFSVKGLCKILPDGYSTIQNSLNRLETLGYLKRRKLKDVKGRFYDVEWQVYEKPIIVTDNAVFPFSENPNTDIPCSGLLDAENQIQSITKVSSNKKSITKESNSLSKTDYDKLIIQFGKEQVDYQINKINNHNYKGCMNYEKIQMWCSEKDNHNSFKIKNQFNNFPQRKYDIEKLEQKLLRKT